MSTAGCHSQTLGLGTNAPAYSYAGLLFKVDKVTPYGGATIVVEMGGALKKTIAADNGEFYMVPGVAGLDPPTAGMTAKTFASGCPTVKQQMVAPLNALADGTHDGDCSRSGCHTVTGPGQGPVFLP